MKKILLFVLSLLALAQLNFAQNFEWANGMGSASYEEGRSIAVDAQGNVFTTGIFQGTVDFDPGGGIFNLTGPGRNMRKHLGSRWTILPIFLLRVPTLEPSILIQAWIPLS